MVESQAILQYLAEKYGKFQLNPKASKEEKAAYYQALIYPTSIFDEIVLPAFVHSKVLPEPARQASIVAEKAQKFESLCKPLLKKLLPKGKKFIAGDEFTIADIGIGYVLNLGEMIGWLDSEPELKQYVQRIRERPAFQRTWNRKHADYAHLPEN